MLDVDEQLASYGDALEQQLVSEGASSFVTPRRFPRVLVAAVVLLIAAVGVAVLVASRDDDSQGVFIEQPEVSSTTSVESPLLEGTWRTSDSPFASNAIRPVAVSAGETVIVIDRSGVVAALDPATMVVGPPVATLPVIPTAAFWTGSEILVVGWEQDSKAPVEVVVLSPQTWQYTTMTPPQSFGPDGGSSLTPNSAVWTGRELVLWSSDADRVQPTIFSAVTGRWWRGEPSDLQARSFFVAAWTGSEAVVWGGCTPIGCDEQVTGTDELRNGAAYDPVADVWRPMADAPARGDHPAGVWSGTELVVFIGQPTEDSTTNAIAYDPAKDEWRALPAAPLTRRSYVTGDLVDDKAIFFGGTQPGGGARRDGAAYDPASGEWYRLPDAPEGRERHGSTSTGQSLVVVGGCVVGDCSATAGGPLVFTRTATFPTDEVSPEPTGGLQGLFRDDRRWTVRLDENGALCATIADVFVGCHRPEPRSKPIVAAAEAGPFPEDESGQLMYGFMEPGAEDVRLFYDDGLGPEASTRFNPTSGVWVAVLTPGDNPDYVVYTAADGTVLATQRPF